MAADPSGRPSQSQILASEFCARLQHVCKIGEGHFVAFCPIHEASGDTHRPSLEVRDPEPGRWTQVRCWAGCAFSDIVRATGFEIWQLGPLRPFQPSVRGGRPPAGLARGSSSRSAAPGATLLIDPERELLARLLKLGGAGRFPPVEQMRQELVFLGRLLLSGSRGMQQLFGYKEAREFPYEQAVDYSDTLEWYPIRLAFLAAAELTRQGIPWHSFPPAALARELALVGREGAHLLPFARLAIRYVRRS